MTNRPLSGDSISDDWPPPAAPPPKLHPLRLSTVLLLVTLLSVVAFGVNRTVRQAASASPLSPASWASSETLPSLAPPAASAPRRPPTDLARRAPVGHPGRAPRAGSSLSSSGTSSGSLDLATLAAKVDPGLVDINTQLGNPNAQAAGTGIVLDSSGDVLTNNHVISGATGITDTTSATARPTRPP